MQVDDVRDLHAALLEFWTTYEISVKTIVMNPSRTKEEIARNEVEPEVLLCKVTNLDGSSYYLAVTREDHGVIFAVDFLGNHMLFLKRKSSLVEITQPRGQRGGDGRGERGMILYEVDSDVLRVFANKMLGDDGIIAILKSFS
jgi:hypothetical protein